MILNAKGMKDVDIYIKEKYDSDTKAGYYDAMLISQGKELIFSNFFDNTSHYKLVLQGAIDAVNKLNQPCLITMYTKIPFGMLKIRDKDGQWRSELGKSVNIDLLLDFKKLLVSRGHLLKNVYDKDVVEAVLTSDKVHHDFDSNFTKNNNKETIQYDYSAQQTNAIENCVFCRLSSTGDFINESPSCFAIYDAHPVSPGHVLIVSKRHITSFMDLSTKERESMNEMLIWVKKMIDKQFHPDGYNVGFNIGEAAGQTVTHANIHIIPRYKGDVENPEEGIRGVIPRKHQYCENNINFLNSLYLKSESFHRRVETEEIQQDELSIEDKNLRQQKQTDIIKKEREQYPNAYMPWDEDDDSLLIIMYEEEGKSIKEISDFFERGPGAIRRRLKKLGKLE